ncbi:calcium-binding protein [Jannaschia sp. 2305UL9-9]|uniref:calcium-binding protein n=1 Tax=Jannaschia sp. 2305UL9-9 TaxID=3121638 RepID=UPI0035288066
MTTIPLNTTLRDGNNFIWDIQSDGVISNGTNDAFDGGFRLGFARGFFSTAEGEDGDRELAIGPFTGTGAPDIQITRKIHVSDDAGFARFLDSVTNTGDTTVTYTYQTRTNLGSDSRTNTVDTSDGDQLFSPEDFWIVTDDEPNRWDPAVAHVFGNGGGLAPTTATLSRDNLAYTFALTLAPGETRSILQFGVQDFDPDTAVETAERLSSLVEGLGGLSQEELDQIVNFDLDIDRTPVTLDGGAGNDPLEGGLFEDTLRGQGGDDTIIGNSGADLLEGGAGADSIEGGRGDDTIDGGAGGDTVAGGSGSDSITGGDGDDSLDAGAAHDTVTGDAGDDTILGGTGNDDLSGGDGDDAVEGQNGHDTIAGGTGNDTLGGATGDDSLSGGEGDDRLSGGDGDDTILGGDGADSIGGGWNDDRVFAGAGNDTVTGDALGPFDYEFGRDFLNGMDGDDLLSGGRGNDTLAGQDGNDTLAGGRGDDLLFGGTGDDFLFGGIDGSDRAWGGDGADRFFSTGVRGGETRVMDYDADEGDVLVVDGQFFSADDFEVRGLTVLRPGGNGPEFRPEELVRLLPNGDAVTVFTFTADFDSDRIVLRLPFEDEGETVTFDLM